MKSTRKKRTKYPNLKKLTNKDYEYILSYYGRRIPKTVKKKRRLVLKEKALNVLREKLCSCKRKVYKNDKTLKEPDNSTGICIKSVLHRKGFRPQSFSCKNKTMSIKRDNKLTRKTLKNFIKK